MAQPAPPSGFTVKDPPKPPAGFEVRQPVAPPKPEPDEPPSILDRMGGRFFGTDVQDEIPWTRLGTIISGAMGGAWAGAELGGAALSPLGPVGMGAGAVVGGITGSVMGTTAGAALPEVVMDLGEKLGLASVGTRERYGLNNEELSTVLKGEALIDAATGGGLAVLRLAGRGAIGAFTGITRQGRELAEQATREGINMMPVSVGNRTMPRSLIAIFGRFPFVATPIRKQGQAVDRALTTAFENLPARIAVPASMNEVSADIFSNVKDLAVEIDQQFARQYEEIYKLADDMKVRVRPEDTMQTATNIIAKIAELSPTAGVGMTAPRPAQSLQILRRFISQSFLSMKGTDGRLSPQSLRQMDQLMENIDEQLGIFAKADQGLPIKYLEQLRNAVSTDMINMGRGKIGPAAMAPREIGRRLRAVDREFQNTMADVLENATAKRFVNIQRRGISGFGMGQATSSHIDGLTALIMRGDSPKTVDELAKMIQPETMKKLASSVIQRRLETAIDHTANGIRLNIDKFAHQMGIDARTGGRYLQTERLLQEAGGLSMSEVNQLMTIGRQVASVEIPDVAAFVSRRAGMSGLKGATNVMVPGLAVAGGNLATKQGGFARIVMGGLLFIGGGRMLSRALANPDSARALRYVLREETSRVGRRAMGIRAFRAAIWAGMEAGDYTMDQVRALDAATDTYFQSVKEYETDNPQP